MSNFACVIFCILASYNGKMTIHPTIQRLENILEAKGWSKYRFCNDYGISTQAYNNWRTRGIPHKHLKKVARFLGVYDDWLEDGVGSIDGEPLIIAEETGNYLYSETFKNQLLEAGAAVAKLIGNDENKRVNPEKIAIGIFRYLDMTKDPNFKSLSDETIRKILFPDIE